MNLKWIDEVGINDVLIAGGKGANLGEVYRKGIHVPEAFVITSEIYINYLKENSLDVFIMKKLTEAGKDKQLLKKAIDDIREEIMGGNIPLEMKNAVSKYYSRLGQNVRVAVRSSATAEDLPDASFAGQQETYLNVIGEKMLFDKIKECYASLWGYRAVIYRQLHGYNHMSTALAVVVQKMVESEKAGVLFTMNPTNNKKDEILINGSYGLGEAVVSGMVTPDEYICDCNGKRISTVIGSKEFAVIYDSSGTKTINVDVERRKKSALSERETKMLVEEGIKIEKHYGVPMDVEWAIYGGQVYILQARAITTLSDTVDEQEVTVEPLDAMGKKFMTFMLEKCQRPYLPLDFHISMALYKPKTKIMKEIGLNMEMGFSIDELGITRIPRGKKSLNRNIFHLLSTYRAYKDIEKNRIQGEKLLTKYKQKVNRWRNEKIDDYSLKKCGDSLKELYALTSNIANVRFRYFVFPSILAASKLRKYLHKIDKKLSEYDLLSGLSYKTWEINMELSVIAKRISNEGSLKQDIMDGITYEKMIQKYPQTRNVIEKFLDKYGYKSDYNCYCFSAKSWNEEHERLMPLLGSILISGESIEQDSTKYNYLLNRLHNLVGDKKFEKLHKKIEFYRWCHVNREESQYQWETVFGIARKVYAQITKLLKEQINKDELMYLFMDELLEVCKIGQINEEMREHIITRKKHRKEAEIIWEKSKLMVLESGKEYLSGISASPGITEGKVCIITNTSEFRKLKKGDILVCKFTDPEWTPLFNIAAAVISDTGGALSHAAIVAREYGIPAVLGTGNATAILKDGEIIRVNGTEGKVSKVE